MDNSSGEGKNVNMQQMQSDAASFGVEFDNTRSSKQSNATHSNDGTPSPQTKENPSEPQKTSEDKNGQSTGNGVVFGSPASQNSEQTPPNTPPQTQNSDPSSQKEIDLDSPDLKEIPTPQPATTQKSSQPSTETQSGQQSPDQTPSSYDPNTAVRSQPSAPQEGGEQESKQGEGGRAEGKPLPEDDIELPREKAGEKTHVPDPLFASRVLEQEKRPPSEPKQQEKAQREDGSSSQKSDADDAPAATFQKKRDIPVVRTYKGDVAEVLKKNKTSQTQMVLAEHQKKEEQKEARSPKSKHNLPLLIGSIVFGVIGLTALVGGAVYFYTGQEKKANPAETVEPHTLLFAEERKEIDITDKSPEAIRNAVGIELSELDIRLDFVENVYFTEYISASDQPSIEKNEVKNLVSTTRFFESVESRMPDTLKRALSPQFMYGIHSFNGNQPFIVLKTDFFENAFAGMLNWEPFMARDILPLFNIPVTDEIRNEPFTDIVIKNRDLRALLGPEDEDIVLLYTFFDRETIIITAAEETLEEVVTRLQRPATQ